MDSPGGGLLACRKLSEDERTAKQAAVEAGNAAFDGDDLETALNQYHKASLIDGSDADIWCSLGLAYANLGFNREAWRSYMLALKADPDHVDSLWYAGEFLFNHDDFELAVPLLLQYVSLEKDESKLSEAQELIEEIKARLSPEQLRGINPRDLSGIDDDGNELETDDDELEGFGLEGGEPDDELEEADDLDDDYEFEELETGDFQAGLNLVLTGMQAKCSSCSTSIPEDAPYCYNCKSPHFYTT